MYPCTRPQSEHRRTTRDWNFGVRRARISKAFRAITIFSFIFGAVSPRCGDVLPNNPAHKNENSQRKFIQTRLQRQAPLSKYLHVLRARIPEIR